MNATKTPYPAPLVAAVAMATALLGFTTASAQTPPTPTHTFQPAGSSGAFGTNTNWSGSTLPVAGSQVLIADGKTATMTQANADTLFGSLTLGTNSVISLAASDNQGLQSNSVVYFNNGSQLNFTSGKVNRGATYNILSGATAQMQLAGTTSSDAIPQGSLVGGSNTTVNFKVINTTNLRWDNASFSGTLNYQPNVASTARIVSLTSFGGTSTAGPGTTNFDGFVRGTLGGSNKINDSGTLQLTGTSGGASNVKFDLGANSDTIGNFVIASPTGATASAPTLRGSAALTVSGTTTFQGTAGDVNIDTTGTTNNLLTTGSMTFGGTGTWAVSGDGRIRLNAASGTRTITTNTNASIANPLVGTQGFTKAGAGTLTLTGDLTNLNTSGDITLSAGQLFFNGATNLSRNVVVTGNAELRSSVTIPGVSISTGGTLNIGTTTAVETITTSAFSLASTGTAISFQYSANGVNDQIVAPTLNLTGVAAGGITINGFSLGGYAAQPGDVFTLFNGAVTGFDVNKFVLNMPVLTDGNTWKIQEGSLQLVVVPEPSGILLSGIALMGLILRRRR